MASPQHYESGPKPPLSYAAREAKRLKDEKKHGRIIAAVSGVFLGAAVKGGVRIVEAVNSSDKIEFINGFGVLILVVVGATLLEEFTREKFPE